MALTHLTLLHKVLRLTFYLALALLSNQSIYALSAPERSSYDHRIRYTNYNPADVVQIDSVIGIATHIMLEEGETYLTHAFGDASAWSFVAEKNHIFIKPKAENADTNLILITNRRSYNFRLSYQPSRSAAAVYQLVFRYPDTATLKLQAQQETLALAQSFKVPPGGYNLAYEMSGDLEIAPINVWDNGRFTYFKFPGNRDLPAIYKVDTQADESIVNRHIKGSANHLIVVETVNPKWILRLGEQTLAIYNEAFNPSGIANQTGTASPAVRRIIKEPR
ncbi:P-type conjugative transfer protein VirB9 [Mycoavidus sp. B2-EB]|uniref:P-type conjugative transfer protein VirB9 n=1 Tax=Mycoavidus sp. B2-EB TaxID=2651972 RepID=UPI001627D4E5|nr:P-type conjugative transfer protein VirB9 [Mycoavidus sp. B2-EB]BBO60329.1 P-type conjugative transfer protein VirB9 [Mycoavidus sp. B2-EB]